MSKAKLYPPDLRWHPNRKRDDSLILELRNKGFTIKKVATITGFSPTTIQRALKEIKMQKALMELEDKSEVAMR